MHASATNHRSRRRWIIPVLVAVAIIGLIVAVTLFRGWRQDAEAGAPVAEAPAAAKTIKTQTRPRAAKASQVVNTSDPDDWQQNREEATKEAQRKAENQHRALAARFAAEQVDARWAAAQQADILAASKAGQIAQLQAQPKQIDIDCKSSTCRIEADFPRRSVAEDWLTLFLMNMGTGMANATYEYSTNPDGSARLTVYGVSGAPD